MPARSSFFVTYSFADNIHAHQFDELLRMRCAVVDNVAEISIFRPMRAAGRFSNCRPHS